MSARRAAAIRRTDARLARSAADRPPARRRSGVPVSRPVVVSPSIRATATTPVLPADLADALREGRLSQRCPACGTVEAAGFYCTRCLRPAGPDEWLKQGRGRPASGPQKPPENGINRGPGRPRAHPGAVAPVTDPAAGFWPA